jgi:adenosylcobinamide kinase/adenosylcobinamide-phosphate guanylyltransferase
MRGCSDDAGYHDAVALTLILGGARSGKSDLALRLAAASKRPVLFVATMEAGDDEMRARIDAHRAGRPDAWRTVEAPTALLDALAAEARAGECVLIDCVTLWVSNVLLSSLGDDGSPDASEIASSVRSAVLLAERLAAWSAAFEGEAVVVSNEVGGGVVPAYALGRAFRDALGGANRALASRAGRVYHVEAGLAVDLKALGAQPIETLGEAHA